MLSMYLSGQTKFSQINTLYIINGKVGEFIKENEITGQFSVYVISSASVALQST